MTVKNSNIKTPSTPKNCCSGSQAGAKYPGNRYRYSLCILPGVGKVQLIGHQKLVGKNKNPWILFLKESAAVAAAAAAAAEAEMETTPWWAVKSSGTSS